MYKQTLAATPVIPLAVLASPSSSPTPSIVVQTPQEASEDGGELDLGLPLPKVAPPCPVGLRRRLPPPTLLDPSELPVEAEGKRPRKSYKEAFVGNKTVENGFKLHVVEGVDENMVEMVAEDIAQLCRHWASALVGFVASGPVPFSAMDNFACAKWDMVKPPKIVLIDIGVFLFRLDTEVEGELILESGPWIIRGVRPILLRKWTLVIELNIASFKTSAVSVSFPNLDLHFWPDKALSNRYLPR